jgi:oxygen-independent coproporphyrinogen III oxidase
MKGKNDFLPALLKEMELRRDYIGEERVDTVYFGGGTPSLLTPQELERITHRLRSLYTLAPDAEITLEANPDDITLATLTAWRAAGINRLSIGVQSFFEPDLQWMNRAHDASQARECIRLAQDQGFDNMSIDLIYGGPTLPDDHWKYNVEQAIGLNIPHLSCYALTVEPKTALDTLIRRRRVSDVNPDDQARQFLLLMQWTASAGYEHYEISNFALPGKWSRHNSAYWQGKTYLGLGPSAHSFNGISRQWNVANNAKYSAGWLGDSGTMLIEKEDLTSIQQLNEYIMISLRTMEGSSLATVAKRFGTQQAEELWRRAERYMKEGKIKSSPETLMLTQEGKLLADGIAADLFFE